MFRQAISPQSDCLLGIIGCGRVIESHYIDALRCLSGIRIVALADSRKDRRELVGNMLAVEQRFDSAESLLESTRPDAVIVATPADSHAEILTAALRAGVAVLVEKPLATDIGDLKKIRLAAEASDGFVTVGFNRRFWKPIEQLRTAISAAKSMDAIQANLVMRTDIAHWLPVGTAADVLDDLGCHQLDLVRYLFQSDIHAIEAVWLGSNVIRMELKMTTGVHVTCLSSHLPPSSESISVRWTGARFKVVRGSDRIHPVAQPWRWMLDSKGVLIRKLKQRPSTMRDSFRRQLQMFIHSVRTGRPSSPDLDDGIAAVNAVTAVRQSAAASGKKIMIAEIAN